MEKRVLCVFVAFMLFPALTATAHPGGTDKNGCHTEKKTGIYHCHGGTSSPPPKSSTSSAAPSSAAAPSTSTSATTFAPVSRWSNAPSKPSTTASTAAAPPQASSNLVRATQNLLRILGFLVDTNGNLTSATRSAIEMFQRQEKQDPTGVPDDALIAKLSERVAEHVKQKCW